MNYRSFLRSVFRCSFTLLLAITFTFPLFGQQPPVIYNGRAAVAEEIIIRLRSDNPGAWNRARSAAPFAAVDSLSPGLELFLVHAPANSLTTLLRVFSNHPDVLYAEPNYIVQSLSTTPNDSQFASLWGMVKIEAPGAWDITTGGTSFVAGVVDSGVDYNHPDLAGNIWSAPTAFTVNIGGNNINCPAGSHGFNAINSSCDPMDNNNHGSHTSGTIGATGNNSIGVAGVNWQARIMGLKFLGASGNGSTSDAIKAIEFAIQAKAVFAATATPVNVRVLSNSWGGGGFSQSLLDEINKANTNDMLFVASAGNDSANNDSTATYPANYSTLAPNVISVAATDSSDHIASFSNYGLTKVQLGAPGVNILSTIRNGGYSYFNGTSMAAPHVSGAALLALTACPSLTTAALKNLILANVDPVTSLAGITVTGGRLNVNKIVRSCTPDFSISANPSSLTLAQGASGNSTVTVTALNGFSGSVGLAVAGCPSGATCSLSTPVSPAPTATSTLTVSTNTGTSTGPFTLTITGTQGALSHTTTVSLTVNPAGTSLVNVALAANGGVASASSTYGSGFLPATTIDGERRGLLWGDGGGWADATTNLYPDWLEVDFNGMKTINEIDVFSVQDNYKTPSDPTPTMTFTLFGLRDFEVQYWTGSAWAAVPGGTVTGNNLVWRKFTFAPLATTKIRVFVTASANPEWSEITEIEAYTTGSSTPDFSISANPSSLALAQGASGNSTVTVTALNGFSGSVGLAVAGCPSGATCSLSTPVSPAPTATSTLTVSTNTGTSTGPFTLTITGTQGALSHTTTVSLTVNPAGTSLVNVALAANGGVASASSTLDSGFLPSTTIDGERKGLNWANGGGWADATPNVFPDWLEVDFNGTQIISEIDVFSVQDNYKTPSDPTPTMTFTLHGLRDFEVQYWTGSAWAPVPGGTVTGNNLVWRKFIFAPLATTKIRVFVAATIDGVWSRITEVEAYGSSGPDFSISANPSSLTLAQGAPGNSTVTVTALNGFSGSVGLAVTGCPSGATCSLSTPVSPAPTATSTLTVLTNTGTSIGAFTLTLTATQGALSHTATVSLTVNPPGTPVNVALGGNGGVALASSILDNGFLPSTTIDGERKGLNWGNGGGWADATPNVFPDWLEVDFNGTKTISEIDVFSVQDNYKTPSDPTPTMTFTLHGLRDFEVQYWTGSAWAPIPGGTVTGNNLVWRKFTFAPLTTTKIRVFVTATIDGVWSRITEVEAYSF